MTYVITNTDRPGDGIQQMIFDSIMKTGIDMRKDLFRNVILSGGSTMFPGKQGETRTIFALVSIIPACHHVGKNNEERLQD